MGIGINLKNILNEKNISIQELSRLSGISPNTLYGIVKRDNITLKPGILTKISNALDVPRDRILGLDLYQKRIDELSRPMSEASRRIIEQDEEFVSLLYELNGEGIKEAFKRVTELTQLEQYKLKKYK